MELPLAKTELERQALDTLPPIGYLRWVAVSWLITYPTISTR